MHPRIHSWWMLLALMAVAVPAWGQEVRGGLEFSSEAGYLTNPYLDPSIALWDPALRSSYGAAAPSGWLAWAGRRSRVQLSATGRYMAFPHGIEPWTSARVHVGAAHTFGSAFTLGLSAAAGAFWRAINQETVHLLPYADWRISSRTRLRARSGIARQVSSPYTVASAASTSMLGTVGAERWMGLRTRLGASIHASRTEVPEEESTFSGLGGSVDLMHRLPGGASVRAELGLEQYGYQVVAEGAQLPVESMNRTQHDVLWRASLSGEWPITSTWSFVARSGGSRYQSSVTEDVVQDVQVSLGFRVALHGTVYEPPEASPVWIQEEDGVHFRIQHEGDGELYLVGDFNDWQVPGKRMTRISEGVYTMHLPLEPGTYLYRVRLHDGAEEDWLPFPQHALTVTDEYGGRNGLIIVESDRTNDQER